MNIPVTKEQIDMLATSVELMLGMEMYNPDPDFGPEYDYELTYEGLETLRDIIYLVRDSNAKDTT